MFNYGEKTLIMGILNYTPDSFSDGGMHNTPEKALECALEMQSQGADIIDIGCNSTRPGAVILSDEDELSRLVDALESVKDKLNVPVSVDTFYPLCAEYALKNGALIINDVSGTFNKEIAHLVKEYNGIYVVTHNPCGADDFPDYPEGVTASVNSFFAECISLASECGLKKEQLILDPGFGFGKSEEDNYTLLSELKMLRTDGCALLIGLSRKRFIRKGSAENIDFATAAADAMAIMGGADIIRVHNVSAAVASAKVADSLYRKA